MWHACLKTVLLNAAWSPILPHSRYLSTYWLGWKFTWPKKYLGGCDQWGATTNTPLRRSCLPIPPLFPFFSTFEIVDSSDSDEAIHFSRTSSLTSLILHVVILCYALIDTYMHAWPPYQLKKRLRPSPFSFFHIFPKKSSWLLEEPGKGGSSVLFSLSALKQRGKSNCNT